MSDSSVNRSNKVTKMCSSLFSSSTIHELSVLHAVVCVTESGNVVKDCTAYPKRVNCLFDVKLLTEQSIDAQNTEDGRGTETRRRVLV